MFDPWVREISWRRAQQPNPVFLPAESHGQRSLAACCQCHTESDTTEAIQHTCTHKRRLNPTSNLYIEIRKLLQIKTSFQETFSISIVVVGLNSNFYSATYCTLCLLNDAYFSFTTAFFTFFFFFLSLTPKCNTENLPLFRGARR